MKLRNKKTGEIVKALEVDLRTGVIYLKISKEGRYETRGYNSLAVLNAEWEDYEKPKNFWFIDADGEVRETNYISNNGKSSLRKFDNYFETREEAEKAVEKLKAWKRLRDKGFRFKTYSPMHMTISYGLADYEEDTEKDLDLLFGGEE